MRVHISPEQTAIPYMILFD